MSDFIFSTTKIESSKITKQIQSIYSEDKPIVQEFHGEWGSLGVSRNLYNGFEPYETNQFIAVIIGGPILEFQDNHFLNNQGSSEGTKAIYERWIKGELSYEEDLNGPFVFLIINKVSKEVICVTDLMSFIPVYAYKDDEDITLSTHVDVLARISNNIDKIDEVSVADFILHGVITYPYTTYLDIVQIQPASIHQTTEKKPMIESISYWQPKEIKGFENINEAAIGVRNSLKDYISKITNESTNIAQFISGGEDSRTLSGLLSSYSRDAYIFLDQMNREGKIARKVSKTYGANLKVHTREKLHYLNILSNCSNLVGSGSQYHHAHTYGFHKECKLNSYEAVIGGLLSDALLKGSHIKKKKGTGKIPFIPEVKKSKYTAETMISNDIFTANVLTKLTNRRQSHLKYVKEFRKQSAEEWFELWPSSMNMNIPNIHANRRLFRSYEPFTSKEIVKISASVPQKWKMNRRLFHKATKPLLKPTKWLFHGDGWLPYLSWLPNSILKFTAWIYRKIGVKTGVIKGNQGPWGEWRYVVNSTEWQASIVNYSESFGELSHVFLDEDIKGLLQNSELNTNQNVNLLQVFNHLNVESNSQ